MSNVTVLGIDLAKNIFQFHGINARGETILRKKVTRTKVLEIAANFPSCKVFMEACSASHYWARQLIKLVHQVKLISPQYVRPYVKRQNKNDAHDAEAIVEAGIRPNMRFVSIKTVEQHDLQSLHRIRKRLVEERTRLSNHIRGLLMEYGVFIPQGIVHLKQSIPCIIEDTENDLSDFMRGNIQELYEEFYDLEKRIKIYDKKI